MTDETSEPLEFQKILVAVDASVHSRAGLEAAVALAQNTGANIKGVFVRNTEWYQICRLSFISEISEMTGEIRPLQEKSMKEQIRLTEKRIQHMIQFAGEYSSVSHSWKSVTGSVAEQVLEAAEDADLITLGRIGHSFSKRKKLGKSTRTIIQKSVKPVLVMQEGITIGDTIIAVYDATEQSERGLKTALALAEKTRRDLSVLVLGRNTDDLEEYHKAAAALLEKTDALVDITSMKQTHVWDFAHAVHRLPKGILVIPKDQPLAGKHSLETLLDLLKYPLLLVS